MPELPDASDVAVRLWTNWRALRPVASRDVEVPGVEVQRRDEGFVSPIPAIVRQALADATAPEGPALEVIKLCEVVNGTLVRLLDDGAELEDQQVVHLVVNLITVRAGSLESRTYEVAAQPIGEGTPSQVTDSADPA